MNAKKWYVGKYRRQLVDMHISEECEGLLENFSAEAYFSNLKKAKIQSPMIYLQAHTGLCYFPTKMAKTHRAMTGENNKIKQLISLCKQDGMDVVGYYSLIFNNVAADAHPEWEMVNADGTTWRDHGQRYGMCCPNQWEYREFVRKQLQEMFAYYPELDAIFYDMPYWEVACHCPACRARWEKEVGGEMPETIDFSSSRFLTYMKKRQEWMVDFVNYVRETSLSIAPQCTVEFNFAAVIGCDWMGGSTEPIADACEFVGGDLYGDLYSHSFTAKYYYSTTKNQPFEYMTCRCDNRLQEHTVTKPQALIDTEVMLTAAHHGATLNIDAINPDGTMDARVYEKIGAALERQLPYEPYMDRGRLQADVAVFFDSRTQFVNEINKTYNKLCAVNAHKALVESHIPVAVFGNGYKGELNEFPIIVAPCLQDFDNPEILRFIDYVKNGGTLYLSGKSDSRLMKEFFGAEFCGYTYGDAYKIPYDPRAVHAYIAPEEEYRDVFGEFNAKYPLPLKYKLPCFRFEKGKALAKIVLPYTNPDDTAHFASIHSNPPARATDFPAAAECSYGKGRVIWFAAPIEYDTRANIKRVFVETVKCHLKSRVTLTADKFVESVLFREQDTLYISLVDISHPDEDVERSYAFRVRCGGAARISDVATGEEIPFAYENGILTFSGVFRFFRMLRIEKITQGENYVE